MVWFFQGGGVCVFFCFLGGVFGVGGGGGEGDGEGVCLGFSGWGVGVVSCGCDGDLRGGDCGLLRCEADDGGTDADGVHVVKSGV